MILTNDIDLTDTNFTGIPIFSGVFDGNNTKNSNTLINNSVSNLTNYIENTKNYTNDLVNQSTDLINTNIDSMNDLSLNLAEILDDLGSSIT